MKPSAALHQHRTEILVIIDACHTKNARVFGSVAHGNDMEGSDLDLLVDPTPQTTLFDLARIQNKVQKLLKLSVDVITPKDLPEHFRAQVLREAIPL